VALVAAILNKRGQCILFETGRMPVKQAFCPTEGVMQRRGHDQIAQP
jgi:hypothetical protein